VVEEEDLQEGEECVIVGAEQVKTTNAEQAQKRSSFAPVIKRSRRIQELHEKKMAELAEQMKHEQERLEMLAKQKANDELINGKKKFKVKLYFIFSFLLLTF